ncbi:urease accessory protein G isoform X1 [Brassica napus]|uniref:urease accessory protein G isoform X1 n=1 Tax=Brassica napus TaxID=3708 RepID=UPI0006AB13F9|nr:urease accessory protein G isoform X1 [Brassica napus]
MVYHCHDGLAPHSHEPIYSPGYFSCRAPSLNDRNFSERALTVGIGVPVGTGNFEFGVGLQMGSGNWGRYSLLPLKRRLLCCLLQIYLED